MLISVKDFPGILLTVLLALVALWLAKYVSLSVTLIAIILGFVIGNLWRLPEGLRDGVSWTECHVLSMAVALLGAQLNVLVLAQLSGFSALLVTGGLLVTFVVTWLLAKPLGVDRSTASLLASGQGICGTAAVMASQKVVQAPAAQAALVVAWVNFLGFAGIFLLPALLGGWFNGNDQLAGHLIGNTLQSMGHVVAAGFTLSDDTGQLAVLIKMGRILMLIPVLLLLIFWQSRVITANVQEPVEQPAYWRLVPWFIWVFLLLTLASSMGWLGAQVQAVTEQLSDFLFVMAMVAIGLGIRLKTIGANGAPLMLLGGVVFVVQIAFSLMLLVYLQ